MKEVITVKRKQKALLTVAAAAVTTLAVTALLLTGRPSGAENEKIDVKTLCKSKILFGDNDYEKFRIPGIVTTKMDTVLIYFEARKASGDWSAMDIVLFRSTDGGESFSELQCIVPGVKDGITVNNPVITVGQDNTLFLLYCREYGVTERGGGVYMKTSTDDGVTWSEEKDISSFTMPEYRNAFATGPGHGVCLTDGTLIIPVWLVPKSAGAEPTSHHPAEVRVLSSCDNGRRWSLSEPIPGSAEADANETAAAICSDGSVILNLRVPGTGMRGVSYSRTGAADFSPLSLDSALKDPTCFGSLCAYSYGESPYMLLFVNCENTKLRKNLTVKGSSDDGRTWTKRCEVDSGLAGYSDIAADSKGKIYVVYETENCLRASLARFRLEYFEDL